MTDIERLPAMQRLRQELGIHCNCCGRCEPDPTECARIIADILDSYRTRLDALERLLAPSAAVSEATWSMGSATPPTVEITIIEENE